MPQVYETRFAFTGKTYQSARIDARPEQALEFATEAEAIAALANPPKGARLAMVRQLSPERRFIKRKAIR